MNLHYKEKLYFFEDYALKLRPPWILLGFSLKWAKFLKISNYSFCYQLSYTFQKDYPFYYDELYLSVFHLKTSDYDNQILMPAQNLNS